MNISCNISCLSNLNISINGIRLWGSVTTDIITLRDSVTSVKVLGPSFEKIKIKSNSEVIKLNNTNKNIINKL